MEEQRQALLSKLGFRFGINGPHAARTMMLDDLRELFSHTAPTSSREDYAAAVLERNVLAKPTRNARALALRHLATLYALDLSNPIFRALRRLWLLEEAAQPMLALAVALARDPLLRASEPFILKQPAGAAVSREAVEALLASTYPHRFSAASLKSFAQNIAGTWTAAGLLSGRARKTRTAARLLSASVAMLLFLGYLEGRSGRSLFTSNWMSLIDEPLDEREAVANLASVRGLLIFMDAGGIKEVRFPGYLSSEEELLREEVSRVL